MAENKKHFHRSKTKKGKKSQIAKIALQALSGAKATIALCVAITAAFFLLSKNGFFIDWQTIGGLSFGITAPWNIISYLFVHSGFAHLTANVFSILAFGYVVEQKIGTKKTVVLFALSAVLAAIIFSLVQPGQAIFGASLIASGLIGAGFAIAPKKTIIAAILLAVLVALLIRPVELTVYAQHKENIKTELQKAQNEKTLAIKSGETQKAKQAEAKASALSKTISELQAQEQKAFSTETASTAHAFGAIIGFFFAYFYCRKKTAT